MIVRGLIALAAALAPLPDARACGGAQFVKANPADKVVATLPNGLTVTPRPNDLLMPGTRLTLDAGAGAIWVREEIHDRRTLRLGRDRLPYEVNEDCRAPDLLDKITFLLFDTIYGASIPSDSHYLGPQRGNGDEGTKPEAIRPTFKGLPADRVQFIETGASETFVAWTDAAGTARLIDPATGETMALGTFEPRARGAIKLPPDIARGRYAIVVDARDAASSAPLPVEITDATPPYAPDAPSDLAATLTYLDGPPEWTLSALSRLNALKDDSFVALRAWRQAVTDE